VNIEDIKRNIADHDWRATTKQIQEHGQAVATAAAERFDGFRNHAKDQAATDPERHSSRVVLAGVFLIGVVYCVLGHNPVAGTFLATAAITLAAEVLGWLGTLTADQARENLIHLGSWVMVAARGSAVVAVLGMVAGSRSSGAYLGGLPIIGALEGTVEHFVVSVVQTLVAIVVVVLIVIAVILVLQALLGKPAKATTSVTSRVSGSIGSWLREQVVRLLRALRPHVWSAIVCFSVLAGGTVVLWVVYGIFGLRAVVNPAYGRLIVGPLAPLAKKCEQYMLPLWVGMRMTPAVEATSPDTATPRDDRTDRYQAAIRKALEEVFGAEEAAHFIFAGAPKTEYDRLTYDLRRREADSAAWTKWRSEWTTPRLRDALEHRIGIDGVRTETSSSPTARYLVVIPVAAVMPGDDPNDPRIRLGNWLPEHVGEMAVRGRERTYPAGLDIRGETVWIDLATAPHTLVIGGTGSGKSASGIIAPVLALAAAQSPKSMEIWAIDPKRELKHTVGALPHTTRIESGIDAAKIQALVEDFVAIGETRREQLDGIDWTPASGLPWMLLIVEEYQALRASITDAAAKDAIENAINAAAAIGRSAGLHIILAAQKGTTEVISSAITANFLVRAMGASRDADYLAMLGQKVSIPKSKRGRLALGGVSDNGEILIVHGLYADEADRKAIVRDIQNRWPVADRSRPSTARPEPHREPNERPYDEDGDDEPAAPVSYHRDSDPILALGDGWPTLPTADRMSHPDLVDACALILRARAQVGDAISRSIMSDMAKSQGLVLSDHPANALRRGLEDAGIIGPHPTKGRNWVLLVADWTTMSRLLEAAYERDGEDDEEAA
jgi:hypothetical protein